MKLRLLIFLSALLLTGCDDGQSVAKTVRLHVTARGDVIDAVGNPWNKRALEDWLFKEIKAGRVDPDVRLDFASGTPVPVLIETMNEVLSAGAHTKDFKFAFGVDGWKGDDFKMGFIAEECGCEPPGESGADEWGSYTIAAGPRGKRMEFTLEMQEGALSSDGTQLTLESLTFLLNERSNSGEMLVSIHTDAVATVDDVLPLLMMCGDRGAGVYFASSDGDEDQKEEHLKLRHQLQRLPSLKFLIGPFQGRVPPNLNIPHLKLAAWDNSPGFVEHLQMTGIPFASCREGS